MIALVILLIADLGKSISYFIDHSPIAYWGFPVVMMAAAIAITCWAYRLFKRKTPLQKL